MHTEHQRVTWILEEQVFPRSHATLKEAVLSAGHHLVQWDDEWWSSERWPTVSDTAVVFHGSLGNADRIRRTLPWRPGAYCDADAFRCSAWYPRARQWLLHRDWRVMPANALAADPASALAALGASEAAFIRPDSALKPFSGRVLSVDKISLPGLDHGFYFDDPALPVVVAPVRSVGREWRYVVVDHRVVAGSAYASDGRSALPDDPSGPPRAFASQVAGHLVPPEDVYVMDICEADGELRLLELNPFSGADLYACRLDDVVAAVSAAATRRRLSTPG
jgi:ATP-grasp domain, R2K clade family 3